MLPEIGHLALVLSLSVAVIQFGLPLAGYHFRYQNWLALAKPCAQLQFALLLLAFGVLTHAFVQNDFSLLYVAQNSNSALPLPYRISAVWGAHEGSLLLWVLILAGWSTAVSVFDNDLPDDFVALVLAIMGAISIGFLLFMLFTSNPFERLIDVPTDGADLNPLLQDPGLIIHPPMLYMGYVGTAVAFGFALAALIQGRLSAVSARWIRPWVVAAWCFLTIGIALGSWWAYYELGWGGWWFWDPVENASFMPWLLGTALIHSIAVTEKRGSFKNWTLLLAITTFALSLLGTFLVRSGVLTSVHAFATDPARGIFILALFASLIGGALLLYAWRGPGAFNGNRFEGASRETFLLVNSVLLAIATATVLLGTLFPLAHEAFGLGKISVGPPYFNAVFSFVMAPLVLALAFGQFARWKSDNAKRLLTNFYYTLIGAGSITLVSYLSLGGNAFLLAGLGIFLGALVIIGTLVGIWTRCRGRNHPWRNLLRLPRAFKGQVVAHIGFATTLLGATVTSFYAVDEHIKMKPGDSQAVGEYQFSFKDLRNFEGPNYRATEAHFEVSTDDQGVTQLYPQKRFYHVRNMPMTEAGIWPGLMRDLYVSLGEPLEDGAWSVRIHYKPMVRWIWLGAIFMALGGVIALSDPRLRQTKNARRESTIPQSP
ncbi:MAG: heme lyase CcmF/NrfE family subunit [Pseudomonadota bacterium]